MSMGYYQGLMDTLHLLSSPKNSYHLNRSVTQYQQALKSAAKYL